MRRGTLFWIGLAASVAVTALLWWAGIPGGALLLLFPFFWLPLGKSRDPVQVRRCPQCAFEAGDPEARFCPRDGSGLDGP